MWLLTSKFVQDSTDDVSILDFQDQCRIMRQLVTQKGTRSYFYWPEYFALYHVSIFNNPLTILSLTGLCPSGG